MIQDSPFIIKRNNQIEINHGRRFPIRKSYLLFIFLVIVIVASFFLYYATLSVSIQFISLVLLLYMLTANTGVIIKNNSRLKLYIAAFGYKTGSWRKYTGFSCLVLKTTTKKRDNLIVNEIGDGASVIERFKSTELYIMDFSHRKKIFCGSFETYSEAKEFAKKVNLVLGYPIEKFSPKRIQRRK